MAMVERTLNGGVSQIMKHLHQTILGRGEITSCGERTELTMGAVQCAVRGY